MSVNSGIGGQAVMEGIMMRNKEKYAIAVRKPDGEVEVKTENYKAGKAEAVCLKIPVVRGVFSFVDSLVMGISCLMYSATFYEEDEEEEKKPLTQEEIKAKEAAKEKDDKIMMTLVLIISIAFSVALFVMLPYFLSDLLSRWIHSAAVISFIEAVIRVLIFLIYLLLISNMKEIQRTFQYHGAEHKCINCIESGLPLTVDNVLKSSRFHKRCGTSFLFFVVIISAILFMFIRVDSHALRIIVRLLLVPVIAGVSYEVIKFAGSSSNPVISALSKPGLAMQNFTTREPDADMAEVAIQSVEAVFDWKKFENENLGTEYKDISVAEAYRSVIGELKDVCKEEAQNDAWLIISAATGYSRTAYAMNRQKALDGKQLRYIARMVKERKAGTPVQYIIGKTYFYGYEFKVNENVLIPRYDTEVLVRTVLEEIAPIVPETDNEADGCEKTQEKGRGLTILDIGTGSGCIAVSLKKEAPAIRMLASDISEEALKVARENAANLGAAVEFVKSDLFENINEKFDVIVSNPPYIRTGEKESLDTEVKDHEPEGALYAGEDGLAVYRRIAKEAPSHLKENGRLFLEIGADQAADVTELLVQNGFKDIRVVKDLAGLDRAVAAVVGEKNV